MGHRAEKTESFGDQTCEIQRPRLLKSPPVRSLDAHGRHDFQSFGRYKIFYLSGKEYLSRSRWALKHHVHPEKLEMQSSEYRPRVDFVSSPSVMLYAGRGFNLCSLVCFTVKHIPKKIGIYFFSRKIRRRKE